MAAQATVPAERLSDPRATNERLDFTCDAKRKIRLDMMDQISFLSIVLPVTFTYPRDKGP